MRQRVLRRPWKGLSRSGLQSGALRSDGRGSRGIAASTYLKMFFVPLKACMAVEDVATVAKTKARTQRGAETLIYGITTCNRPKRLMCSRLAHPTCALDTLPPFQDQDLACLGTCSGSHGSTYSQ